LGSLYAEPARAVRRGEIGGSGSPEFVSCYTLALQLRGEDL